MPRSNSSSCAHEKSNSFAFSNSAWIQVSKLSVLISLLLIGICCATLLRFVILGCIAHLDLRSHSREIAALLIRPLNDTKPEVTYVHLENSNVGVYQCETLIDIEQSSYCTDIYKSCCTKQFTAEDPLDNLIRHACQSGDRLLGRMSMEGSGLQQLVPDIVVFGYLVVSGAVIWSTCYLYFFLVGGITVPFLRIGLKALADMIYIGLRPVLVACFWATLSRQSSVACVAAWLELALYMVSWMVLLNGETLIAMAEFNLPLKVISGSILAAALLFLPRAISHLELSPFSQYMALNSISGFSLGIAYLAGSTMEILTGFKPPR